MRILRRFLARVKNFAMASEAANSASASRWERHVATLCRCVPSGSGPDTHRHLCVGGALPAARALTQLLFGISPLDATSFARLSFWD